MVASILRWGSLVAVAVLIASFGMFVVDQSRNGANDQIAQLNADLGGGSGVARTTPQNIDQPDPPAAVERVRAKRHGALREKIDEADDVLLKPFTGVVGSKSIWVERGVPTLLALLVFGFGVRMLANYAVGVRRR